VSRAVAPGPPAGLPRHLPRGVRPSLAGLLGLRRYGAEMRRLLAMDSRQREGTRAPVARSQGMDYAESRLYSPGDDVRRIDWRVTARTGRAHTKLFELERGNDIYCIVDQRAPMHFGTRAAFKSVVAADLAALAGWAAAEGGDRFGALIAGTRVASIRIGMAERSTPALCAALVAEASAGGPAERQPVSDTTLDRLAMRAVGEAAVGTRFVLISDFSDPDVVLANAVRMLRARGELMLVWLFDAMEVQPLPPARYPLTDGVTHLVLDTASVDVRAAQAREVATRSGQLARFVSPPGTRCCTVQCGEELFAALARPFEAPGRAPRGRMPGVGR